MTPIKRNIDKEGEILFFKSGDFKVTPYDGCMTLLVMFQALDIQCWTMPSMG